VLETLSQTVNACYNALAKRLRVIGPRNPNRSLAAASGLGNMPLLMTQFSRFFPKYNLDALRGVL
jgi:hypothetical protein